MTEFIATFVLFMLVEFLGVWWAKSIENKKSVQTGLASAGTELLIITAMWIALVEKSITGSVGCVVGAGIGAYIGCEYFSRRRPTKSCAYK